MRKFILLLVVVGIVFVVWNRQRIYVRDPLAKVTRNGVAEHNAQVMINYANDILVENDSLPMYVLLVQHDQHIGMPPTLKCIHFAACLTDADVATLITVNEGSHVDSMSSKSVAFTDVQGNETIVSLH